MFHWADENIRNVKFFEVSTETVSVHANIIKDRYEGIKAVDGTRSFHCYRSPETGKLQHSTLSADVNYTVTQMSESEDRNDYHHLKEGMYISIVYEDRWYIGLILEICSDQRDIRVKCLQNLKGKNSFYWPSRDDIIYVPFNHTLVVVNTPTLSGSTGRNSYMITAKEFSEIEQAYCKFINF